MVVWDNIKSERPLSSEELEARLATVEDFKKWSVMEETSWRQKSREIWLKEGDRCTGFFHKIANSHKRRNTIDRIQIGGEWLVREGEVIIGIVNTFKGLLSVSGVWRASLEGFKFSRLKVLPTSKLEEPFTEEVHSTLLDLNGDKALGLDGFIVAFWQFSWEFVKLDIMALFKDFHERGGFGKSLNSTFLALISKRVAKVLAYKMKEVMNALVNLAQNTFVVGRQILDASLIANEVIDSMQKRKERGILCKLDIVKVYDQINWSFILKVLKRMGFEEKWVGWIKWCISTPTFSILINGSLTSFFGSSRGLRQGDPLSPYLFVLVMEALSLMIDKAVEGVVISLGTFSRAEMTL